jgi:DnaJ-class molecular chaperone
MTVEWNGRVCVGCGGSGFAWFHPNPMQSYLARCPACNGHGREPS